MFLIGALESQQTSFRLRESFVFMTTLCRGRVFEKAFWGGGAVEISSEQLFHEELLEFIFNYTPE